MSNYHCIIELPKKYKEATKGIITREGHPVEWHDKPNDVTDPDYASIWSWVPYWYFDKDNCQIKLYKEIEKQYNER